MGLSIDRRLLLAGLAAGGPAVARASTRDYRGWTIDDDALPGGLSGATWDSLKAQIDLVESVKIRPEIIAYWRSQRLIMDPTLKEPGLAGPMRLFLSPDPQPRENPVLLHELIHVYHFNKIAGGQANPQLIAFYEAAKRGGWYPPRAYVLKNVIEFFAMNASVVLWGKAARPPLKRETVQHNQPDLYAWIVDTFGLMI
jgi:hypothetical protein